MSICVPPIILVHMYMFEMGKHDGFYSISVDISKSVFHKETEATMYVTKDNEVDPDEYFFAIPLITFS